MEDRYYKTSAQVLTVDRSFKPRGEWANDRLTVYIFDFEFRTMTVVTNFSDYNHQNEHSSVHPFPTVDPHLLERMREKLVALDGKPDPVSGPRETKPAIAAPRNSQKGLNP